MSKSKHYDCTPKEHAFCDYYFESRQPTLSAINAGYPAKSAEAAAGQILRRPHIKAYLRKLWEKAESPIIMSVRERLETLSQISRGMIGNCLDESGNVDLAAIREMPAVREVVIEETVIGVKHPRQVRHIKVKLYNPVESIHEINLMENKLNPGQVPENQGNRTVNYYFLDGSGPEKLARIGERTQKVIEVAKIVTEDETG
ncbi:hypothetical protein LCGC14_1876790 [marine sediment metagenome]|uniref:Terminase small subunit n=1 Tax=marine sediment metagenome TaxID=412755 RepID=A0A0F9GRG7_9ZZZZ